MAMETPISYKFISIRSMILLGCEQPSPLHLSPCTDPRGGKKKKKNSIGCSVTWINVGRPYVGYFNHLQPPSKHLFVKHEMQNAVLQHLQIHSCFNPTSWGPWPSRHLGVMICHDNHDIPWHAPWPYAISKKSFLVNIWKWITHSY